MMYMQSKADLCHLAWQDNVLIVLVAWVDDSWY